MNYMLCRHEVKDFGTWKKVFDSHSAAHRAAGMELIHLWRDSANPNLVVFLFRLGDVSKAKAFISAPDVGNVKVDAVWSASRKFSSCRISLRSLSGIKKTPPGGGVFSSKTAPRN